MGNEDTEMNLVLWLLTEFGAIRAPLSSEISTVSEPCIAKTSHSGQQRIQPPRTTLPSCCQSNHTTSLFQASLSKSVALLGAPLLHFEHEVIQTASFTIERVGSLRFLTMIRAQQRIMLIPKRNAYQLHRRCNKS